jgi:hypothetical protein
VRNVHTGKPQYNKSKWIKDFVLYSREFVIAGLFAMELTTEELEIQFFIAGILL